MDKTAIKNFSIWARQKLIDEIKYKAGLIGITEEEIFLPLENSTGNIQFFDLGTENPSRISGVEIEQRKALIDRIKEKEKTSNYKSAFNFVVEEVAYKWFNRLIAIRFMEVNDYLPSGVRVLSSEMIGKSEPDMVTTPFETDMDFSNEEKERILQLKDKNMLDELFRMLFIKQCNELNEILPELFEKTSHYTELLLTISFTDGDGVVSRLVNDIKEEDFKEAVEIIGWLYQYYNTEPKDKVFTNLKKNIKISKDNIPAATQLFTPDWIVRYMVENSLGRFWLEGNYSDDLKSQWRYYLEEAKQEESVNLELEKIREKYRKIDPRDIKLIDPCMGSGHILVYAFELLMQIYESQGYTKRDAAHSIIENNLYGLDIDERAYQLAYFALMMKGRENDRRFFKRGISPQVYCPKDYEEGLEFGSLLKVDKLEPKPQEPDELTAFNFMWKKDINKWNFRRLLNQKYDIVITNPPYMGSRGMNRKLSDYVKKNYPDSKSDLFAAFIEKGNNMVKPFGYNCMVTMQSWMFLSSFEKMRKKILETTDIVNLMHMENMVMGIAFGTAVTIFRNKYIKGYKGTYNYITLKDIGENGLPMEFPVKNNRFAQVSEENFFKIPGSPIGYWASDNILKAFENGKLLYQIGSAKQGLATAKNKRFVRLWHEVIINKIKFDAKDTQEAKNSGKKWFPYNKGGEFRQWYGNYDNIVNWENDGFEIKNYRDDKGKKKSAVRNPQFYFKQAITWSLISSGGFSIRYRTKGSIHDVAGMSSFFSDETDLKYVLGLMSTKIAKHIFKILNPTVNLQIGDFKNFPVLLRKNHKISDIVDTSIKIAKDDWDSFETSWDFKNHPLINGNNIEESYKNWDKECNDRFYTLKANEEELNRIFINIYGLQDELKPEVEEKDVTVRKADLTRDIKSFISYAVGCMFGRYSLDTDGTAYAGGEWDISKYKKFIPDRDNCIPITDEEYFEDDIVGLFVDFVKTVYGEENLEKNLDFIASALNIKGNTSREIIRTYFLKDFYKDHLGIYKKLPIYWLYDSGKENGFKALIYMHRYDADTSGLVRVEYLHQMQKAFMAEIDRMDDEIQYGNNSSDILKAESRKEKLIKQLKETKDYDEKIAHLALSRIGIDLDDGVEVNYEKIQTDEDGKKLQILGKI